MIDTTVDRFTAAVFLKVFSSRRTGLLVTDAVLEDDAVVVSLLIDDEDGDDDWRKHLLLLFKDEVFIDSPSAFTSISFKNIETQSASNLIVTNEDMCFSVIATKENSIPFKKLFTHLE